MKYKVRLNLTNKEYICTHSHSELNGKMIIVDTPKINPTGLEVVETIISKLGISKIYPNPNMWKKDYIDDFNKINGTAYPLTMSFDDFMEILNKDGSIVIEYLPEEVKEEIPKETVEKYIPF